MTGKRAAMVAGGVIVVLALAGAAFWFGPWRDGETTAAEPARPGIELDDPATKAADAFAAAWTAGTLTEAPVTATSGDVAGITGIITAGLTVADTEFPAVEVTGVEVGAVAADDSQTATAVATVTWKLDGGRTWTYVTSIPLVLDTTVEPARWLVAWAPSVVEPSLVAGELLKTQRIAAARGDIVDTTGASLVGSRGSVAIGIKKSRTQDPEGTARRVAGLTGVDAEALVALVAAAGSDDIVPVVTLARADYDKIRTEIQPLPGTVFQEQDDGGVLPPNFARALLGTTGPATAEVAAASEGRVVEGDITGLSGLQSAQDGVLGGTAGVTVQAVAADGTGSPRALEAFPAAAGRPITVTLDQRIQAAADAAIAATATPSALVAIRVSTGDVLAVANGPAGSSAYNRAMIGRYPPGSTFKVATTLALLSKGITPDTVIDCPATIVVGKQFRNAENEVLGSVPFRKDFADSCNTAFVSQATTITAEELTANAALLGYRDLDLGVPVFGGSVPVTDDLTEHAANMIGQGKVEGSPFAVALASASVANGSSLQPRLIIDTASPAPTPGAGLDPTQVGYLRELMRGVVTGGTGGALAGVPGGDVSGKTGTAEFGTEDPPLTHAWFTGFQGDIAFAVLVEDGGFGGAVAAPLAARFLTSLAG